MLAIYTRLSKEDESSTSIANQLREGKEFALSNGFNITKIYNEGEGISATLPVDQRPVFSQLLNDVIKEKVEAIWFRNQNRAERNNLTFNILIDACKRTSTKIYIENKEFDYNDPNQFLTQSILSSLNTYTAQLQGYQTRKVLLANAKEGKFHGRAPYGYTKDSNRRYQINEEEAKTVKLIYKLSLQGIGYDSIAKQLNEKAIKSKYAKDYSGTYNHKNKITGKKTTFNKSEAKWAGNTVRGIIKNTLYYGKKKYKDEFYDVPSIISQDHWEKVNKNLTNNRNNSGKKVQHKYLLKGLIRCAKCGRNYYGRINKSSRDNYYQCSSKRKKSCGNRSISIPKLDNFIWEQLLLNGGLIRKFELQLKHNSTKEKQKEHLKKIALLKNENKQAEKKIDDLIDLKLEGNLSKDRLNKKLTSLEKMVGNNNEIITTLKKETDSLEKNQNTLKKYKNKFSQLSNITTLQEKKEILNNLIKEIKILSQGKNPHKHLITVELNIPPFQYNIENWTFANNQFESTHNYNGEPIIIHADNTPIQENKDKHSHLESLKDCDLIPELKNDTTHRATSLTV